MSFQLAGNSAEIYEQVLVPLWFQKWAERLLGEARIETGHRVLDIACGTGVTTRLIENIVGPSGRVVGLDINAPMLESARALAGDSQIEWLEADVCANGFPDASFDAIISQHGYHYFPDKPAALVEMHRLLPPGGQMSFNIWDGHSPYTDALCAAVEKHISKEIADRQRAQRTTPSANELYQQLAMAGFSNVEIKRQEIQIEVPQAEEFVPLHIQSMPIAAAFLKLSAPEQTALVSDVSEAMDPFSRANGMTYPDAVHVAKGDRVY